MERVDRGSLADRGGILPGREQDVHVGVGLQEGDGVGLGGVEVGVAGRRLSRARRPVRDHVDVGVFLQLVEHALLTVEDGQRVVDPVDVSEVGPVGILGMDRVGKLHAEVVEVIPDDGLQRLARTRLPGLGAQAPGRHCRLLVDRRLHDRPELLRADRAAGEDDVRVERQDGRQVSREA